jgi:hypothetical protein
MALTPSGEKLVVLLNETFTPPTIFDDKRITFGAPTDVSGQFADYDTVVMGSAIPGMGYYGDAEIHYTRVPLSNLGTVTLASLTGWTNASLIAALNAQCQAFLDPVDFQAFTVPTVDVGQTAPLTLTADPTSLGWKGSITLTLAHDKPQLSSVVGNKTLATLSDGLSTPGARGRAMLFNVDFTSYRDAIKPTLQPMWPLPAPGGYGFADYAALSDVCTRLGIPGFPAPQWTMQVADHATSEIADSNKNFDRVVVMGYVGAGAFSPGPLYFHYNLLDNR